MVQEKSMSKKITLSLLVLLILSAIDSNRNLPSTAIFGAPLIFFFLFAAVFFFFPTALVSAELASAYPTKGGIYHWVKEAFGEKWGMVAIWLQWINTVVWFPTILSFIAGSLAFLFDPQLTESKSYMIVTIALLFWLLTFVNLFGLQTSTRLNAFFVIAGTLVPMAFLLVLGAIWLINSHPIQISFSLGAILPEIQKLDSWVALEAVIGSFIGMELAGVHVRDVIDPRRNFPKALGVAAAVILGTMLFGALTIAIVLPQSSINLAGGIMQVFAKIFAAFHLDPLTPLMSCLIVLGSVGGMINWLISPARGLLNAASDRFFPRWFTQLNRHGVAQNILFAQAFVVTLLCGVLLILPSVNAFYWLLTALSDGLYMMMYFLLFGAAIKLRVKTGGAKAGQYQIPGGYLGLWGVVFLGVIGTFLTFFFGFVPPPNVDVGSSLRYVLLIAGGNILFVLPVWLCIRRKKVEAV